jgi:hypothetical protein
MLMCPNCGSGDCCSNLIDEAPYRLAARSAGALRRCGDIGAATDVLTGLASVKIINFIRMRWRCENCGASFDE